MKLLRYTTMIVLLVGFMFLSFGCKDADNNGEEPPAPSTPVVEMSNVVVYYPKITETDTYLVREVHEVKETEDMLKTAIEELINGNPVTNGAFRVIPSSAKVLGVVVDGQGGATINFSPEVLQANVGASGEVMGIASIVNTLTEFENIKKVSFMVDSEVEKAMGWWGHVGLFEQPFNRDLAVVYEPTIWVTSPAPGQMISNPVEITGSAMVFEATVNIRVTDSDGKILGEGFSTASAGAPDRGDFKTEIDFKTGGPGDGVIEVFWESPKDGSELDKVVIPVEW